ncbi:MAG TPA: excinuclease ABC subunit UvrA [Acidimicrobiales bacterium]|jgi:excinuclease ABC subunit A|nr:excinuclease ABC subunit UvrA [Acidimicrobiales bacterium]
MADRLVVRGAREHNLQDVSLDLPRDRLIVFTGLSGSGKSSLAFDTIYAEGQRRYVESLSAYARQFLGQMDKPDVDFIEGLSPAIAIDQKSASRNPRSTVGTVTEVYDYLRLLYARIGKPHCPTCGRPVVRQSPQQIVDRILAMDEGTRFLVLAPVVRGRKGEYSSLLDDLAKQGFARVRVDGDTVELSERSEVDLARYEQHTIEVVVDRLIRRDDIRRRLTESLETALSLAEGVAEIVVVDADGNEEEAITFSQHLACTHCGTSFEDPAPRNFSFNSPYGACPVCNGLGTRFEVDPELVVPDPTKSLAEGALAPWSGGRSEYFTRVVEAAAELGGFSVDTPWEKLTKADKKLILYGAGTRQVHLKYRNRYGRSRSFHTRYEGIIPWLQRRHQEAESDFLRDNLEGYLREVPCPTCGGARLKPESLAVTVGGLSIFELCSLPIGRAVDAVVSLDLSDRDHMIADRVFREVRERMQFLLDVGLDYLTLARSAATLSGGEAQRIRLASQIGSGLVGVLYVLDEPSIGLHQRDNKRLITTLDRLRDLGNTVIVVEHDEETIRASDHVVDVGPGAGEHGGRVVHSGPVTGPGGLESNPESITGQYLSGAMTIPMPQMRRPGSGDLLVVEGAREHNLHDVDAEFPLGCLVAVTGVSGSGKSTLVNDILLRSLSHQVHRSKAVPGLHRAIRGVEHIDKVVEVDQAPIGRTPRSNPATYTGVFDHIRRLFSLTQEAKVRGYLPGRFSFNVKGGRCEACSGDGTIRIEMHFLPDVYVPCEVCHGARYNRDTLEVTFRGKTIADVLDLSCEEGLAFFAHQPPIARHLQTLVDVGLGYIRLGQPAPTLSGGEAQRVKLSAELSRRSTGHTLYVLDEPTTGLHFDDVRKLLNVLSRLVDQGNTVIVIEHNLDVIKSADWIIDLGPEGGDRGGNIVAVGTPEEVAVAPGSYTGEVLAPVVGVSRSDAKPKAKPKRAVATNGSRNGSKTVAAKAGGVKAGAVKAKTTKAGAAKAGTGPTKAGKPKVAARA